MGANYGSSKKLAIKFSESFDINDIEEIVKEAFKEEYKVEYIDEFKAGVIITVKTASDEQIEMIENKLKEKYNSFTKNNEENKEDVKPIEVIDMPNVDVYDLVREYIKPILITFVVTIVIFAILFRKLGLIKSLLVPALIIIGINALYISVISILRIPVSEYIISVGLFVYATSLIGTAIYEKTIS